MWVTGAETAEGSPFLSRAGKQGEGKQSGVTQGRAQRQMTTIMAGGKRSFRRAGDGRRHKGAPHGKGKWKSEPVAAAPVRPQPGLDIELSLSPLHVTPRLAGRQAGCGRAGDRRHVLATPRSVHVRRFLRAVSFFFFFF